MQKKDDIEKLVNFGDRQKTADTAMNQSDRKVLQRRPEEPQEAAVKPPVQQPQDTVRNPDKLRGKTVYRRHQPQRSPKTLGKLDNAQ